MGLFGKFFDKKQCSICGVDIGLLGNRKLEDGNLCKECARKLSPFFDNRRHSTVEQISEHLAYREKNKQDLLQFKPTISFGNNGKIHIEMENGIPKRFVISSVDEYRSVNADIVSFSNVVNCTSDIHESRTEEKYRNSEGEYVSYSPPRYEYKYDFYIKLDIANCSYFDEMSFRLNPRTIELKTVEEKNVFSSFTSNRFGSFDPMLYPEYREYKSLCDQVCQYVSAGQRGVLVSNTDGQNVNLGDVLSKLGAQLAGGLSGTAGTMNQVQSNSNLTAPANTWKCHCGHENTGNFCSGCGSTKSAQITDLQDEWKCFCGTVNKGRFCSNCGNKQFTLEDIECSECSWKAESGLTVVPAFCPNCGKRFDKNDLQ